MSRMTALVLAVLGSLYLPGQAFAQLTPPAGSAGAGNSAISGVPYGPANPRVLFHDVGSGRWRARAGLGSRYLCRDYRRSICCPCVSVEEARSFLIRMRDHGERINHLHR
jgi:hypothetical protein